MVGLAEAGDDEGARRQAGKARSALVLAAVVDHVLVDLVADQQHVGGRQQFLQLQHLGIAPDGGAGVVRAVDDQKPCARREGGGNFGEVGLEAARRQRHAHGHAAGQLDVGHVAVVAGVKHDDLIARMHGGQDGGEDGLRGAGRDRDLGGRVVAAAVQRLHLVGHGLAQLRQAGHGRVLVVAGLHGGSDGINQPGVAAEVGEALAQVHRLVLGGQRRHGGEDGRAHMGQAAGEGGRAGRGRCHGGDSGKRERARTAGPVGRRIRVRSRARGRSWRA